MLMHSFRHIDLNTHIKCRLQTRDRKASQWITNINQWKLLKSWICCRFIDITFVLLHHETCKCKNFIHIWPHKAKINAFYPQNKYNEMGFVYWIWEENICFLNEIFFQMKTMCLYIWDREIQLYTCFQCARKRHASQNLSVQLKHVRFIHLFIVVF